MSSNIDRLIKAVGDLSDDSKIQDKMSEEIWQVYLSRRQTVEDIERKRGIRDELLPLLRSKLGEKVDLYFVGSTASGFANKSSDLDMCLLNERMGKPGWGNVNTLETVQNIIRDNNLSAKSRIVRAKTPIINYVDIKTGINVSINQNSLVGIRNTRLLYGYYKADWRVAPLVHVIKQWAESMNIIGAYDGYLSSYAFKLMIIFFLQKYRVVPALQSPAYVDHFSDYENVRAFPDLPPIDDLLATYLSPNEDSLSQLFISFINYYSNFDFSQTISVRHCKLIPFNHERDHFNGLVNIQEPFNMSNVAYAVHDEDKFDQIVATFQASHEDLMTGKSIK